MIGRLRRGSSTVAETPATPPPAPDAAAEQSIDFRAYTATAIVTARFKVREERLTDELNHHDAVILSDVTFLDLETLTEKSVPNVVIPRDDLLIVRAAGPRGSATRRLRTWPHEVSITIGPYRIQALIHTIPGAHPTSGIYHRKPMVPLTDATISYDVMGRPIDEVLDTIIINRDAMTSINLTEDLLAGRLRAANATLPPDHAEPAPLPALSPALTPAPALTLSPAPAPVPAPIELVPSRYGLTTSMAPAPPVPVMAPPGRYGNREPDPRVLEPSRRSIRVVSDPGPMTPTYMPRPPRG